MVGEALVEAPEQREIDCCTGAVPPSGIQQRSEQVLVQLIHGVVLLAQSAALSGSPEATTVLASFANSTAIRPISAHWSAMSAGNTCCGCR